MKERPILFTPENAQKVYNGTKTQTRRLLKVPHKMDDGKIVHEQPYPDGPVSGRYRKHEDGTGCWELWGPADNEGRALLYEWGFKCPFGAPGDRLWVKESFKRDPHNDCMVFYKDGTAIQCNRGTHQTEDYKIKQMSGMFMPRWASRSILEITDIRIQRLLDISEEDAEAEGIDDLWLVKNKIAPPRAQAFMYLWDSINGVHSHKQNPFVWAITFRKV